MNVRACIVTTLASTAMLMAGCEGLPGNYPGGTMASLDRFVYTSTTELPQSVALVDTRTGQTFWSKDVPVGKQLVLRFTPVSSRSELIESDRMDWAIMEIGRFGTNTLDQRMFVPPSNSRRLDVSYRAAGELPPSPFDEDALPVGTEPEAITLQTPADGSSTTPAPGAVPGTAGGASEPVSATPPSQVPASAPAKSTSEGESAPPIDLQDD